VSGVDSLPEFTEMFWVILKMEEQTDIIVSLYNIPCTSQIVTPLKIDHFRTQKITVLLYTALGLCLNCKE